MSGNQEAGSQRLKWEGTTSTGKLVPAGVYIVRLTIGEEVRTQKVVIAR
jgi:hypothetical protein